MPRPRSSAALADRNPSLTVTAAAGVTATTNAIQTKRRIVKEVFVETFESSTLHALPNAIRNEFIFMKIFWTILFLGGMGVSIYCK